MSGQYEIYVEREMLTRHGPRGVQTTTVHDRLFRVEGSLTVGTEDTLLMPLMSPVQSLFSLSELAEDYDRIMTAFGTYYVYMGFSHSGVQHFLTLVRKKMPIKVVW